MEGDFGKDNLENFFRKNLGSFEEEPGEGVWNGISAGLEKKAAWWSVSSGLKSGFVRHGITALVTAGLIFWLFSWNTKESGANFNKQLASLHLQVEADRKANQMLSENLTELNQLLLADRYHKENLGLALGLSQLESSNQKALILQLYSKLNDSQESQIAMLMDNEAKWVDNQYDTHFNGQNIDRGASVNEVFTAEAGLSDFGAGEEQLDDLENDKFNWENDAKSFVKMKKRLKNGIGLSSGVAGSYAEFGDGGYNYHGGIQYKRELSRHIALSLGASYRWQQYNLDGSNKEVNEALTETNSSSKQNLVEPRLGEVQDVEKTTDQLKFPVSAMVYVNPDHKAKFFVHSGWAPYVIITQDYLLDYNITDGTSSEQFQDRVYADRVNFDVGSWRNGAGVELNVFNKTQMQFMLYHDMGISRERTEGSRLNNVGFSANWYLARF